MSARVLCFASAKGGAGKTVITATIGAFLNGLGKRVLLIDTDAATNGLTLLYIKEVLAHQLNTAQLSGLFEKDSDLIADSFALPSGVRLIPATYGFVNTEEFPQAEFHARLSSTIQQSRSEFDYVLLDAQAGADFYASVAMGKEISDTVVLVAEYDPMSAAGLERLKGLLRDDLTYARTWILLNKILPEFAKQFSDFLEVARYLSPIPWDADVVRAYARRRLALDTTKGNAFTIAVMQTVRSLLGDEIEKDISDWVENRAAMIRRPLEEQYADLEKELGLILEQQGLVGVVERPWRWIERSILYVAVVSAALGILSILSDSDVRAKLDVFFNPERFFAWFPLVAGVVLAMIAISRRWLFPLSDKPSYLERAKIDRRRSVLEEQLRKLETLRASDPETLLRNGGIK